MSSTSRLRPGVVLEGVTKRYGQYAVLRGITLGLAPGSSTALVGENGAGKSTLVKIITGVVQPTDGVIRVNGSAHRLTSPHEARKIGIGLIPQELAYAPALTVAENVSIGVWPSRRRVVDWRVMRSRAEAALAELGLQIDVRQPMRALTLAERQLVEVAKAIAAEPSLLVLDEPTAALNNTDAARLLSIVRRLHADGRSVVYVSHRLEECLEIADRVVVLRNGEIVTNAATHDVDEDLLVRAMVGSEERAAMVGSPQLRAERSADRPPVFVGRDVRPRGAPAGTGATIEVQRGEVLGLFGLIGSGANQLSQALAGAIRTYDGELEWQGVCRPLYRRVFDAVGSGIVYLPAERKVSGLALRLSIAVNVTIGSLARSSDHGVIKAKRERRLATDLLTKVQARYRSLQQPVGDLSGGNQQKVLLASRFAMQPSMLIAEEPTRGVDVGARAQIHKLIRQAAADGLAVLVVSSDAREICELADRVLVVRSGRVVAELRGAEIVQEAVLAPAMARRGHNGLEGHVPPVELARDSRSSEDEEP